MAKRCEGIPMLSFVIFLCISASITALSWRSLARPRSHGFWRFFAFELLAGLILLNAPVWFARPLSLVQLASWVIWGCFHRSGNRRIPVAARRWEAIADSGQCY